MSMPCPSRSADGKRVALYRGPHERTWKTQKGVSVTFDDRAMQIALHEAGHAVIAILLREPVHSLKIFPEEGRGYCAHKKPTAAGIAKAYKYEPGQAEARDRLFKIISKFDPHADDLNAINSDLVVLAAGLAAQRLYNPTAHISWASADYAKMEELSMLLAYGRPELAVEVMTRHEQKAVEMVGQNQNAICAVAAELYHAHELVGDEVREIVRLTR